MFRQVTSTKTKTKTLAQTQYKKLLRNPSQRCIHRSTVGTQDEHRCKEEATGVFFIILLVHCTKGDGKPPIYRAGRQAMLPIGFSH
jgi:hypothetical protein